MKLSVTFRMLLIKVIGMEIIKPVYMNNRKTSIYSKDELPTWEELYKFYKEENFEYSRYDYDIPTDPYWKRPRKVVLLALICNQLNKMLYEDNVDITSLIDKYNLKMFKFLLFPCHFKIIEDPVVPPPIYSIPHPETGKFSIFITNEHPRFSIDDFQKFHPETDNICLSVAFNSDCNEGSDNICRDVMDFLMIPIVNYFEGRGIGWKDYNGELIPYERINHCHGAGYDPAL